MRAGILLCMAATFALHAADEPSPEETTRIAAAIEKLGSNEFAERQAADLELQKLGTLARAQLLKANTADAEVRKSVNTLLSLMPPERKQVHLQELLRDAAWREKTKENITKEVVRLYEEWESEEKRLQSIDGTTARFWGAFVSNSGDIKRDFSQFFRYRPDIVLDAIQDLRKAHPEEELTFKNGSRIKLSPARFLASFRPPDPQKSDTFSMIFNGAALSDVLHTLLTQGNLRLFADSDVSKDWNERRIDIRVESATLEKTVSLVFEKCQDLEYAVEGRGENRYIVVRKKGAK